jgi:DNA-binding response OmpR family regulator
MSKKRVVVIDDSTFMLQIADHIITKAGFEAITATNYIEANTHIFTAPSPAMILVDVEMPILSGDKTTKLLKEMAVSRNIPILLMSHKSDDQMQDLCRTSGADGYIMKPLTPDNFEKAVRKYCG